MHRAISPHPGYVFMVWCSVKAQGLYLLTCIGCTILNGRISLNDAVERMWQEAALICLKVLLQHVTGGNVENYGKLWISSAWGENETQDLWHMKQEW